MASITSTNAVVMLSIAGLFDAPQQLQHFAADDIFDADPNEVAETAMGVDGFLTGGFVYTPQKMKISLMADSPSHFLFEQWNAAQRQIIDLYYGTAVITLRSVNRKYALTKGILTTWQPMPSAKKVLAPRAYDITWERVDPAPIGG